MPALNDKEIREYFPNAGWLLTAQELPSTNTVAKELAQKGVPEGSLVIARRQTGGRGRLGRSFESPEGGIYLSLILRPEGTLEQCTMLTMAAAVGVCRAMERELGISPGIKWVNDLYLNGKKICGILTEGAAAGSGLKYAVAGVGINYQTPPFTGELADKAGSLYPEATPPITLSAMAGAVAAEMLKACRSFESGEIYREYKGRSLLIGRRVGLPDGRQATAMDVTREGRLLVELENGERLALNSGEVSVTGRLI